MPMYLAVDVLRVYHAGHPHGPSGSCKKANDMNIHHS